MSLKKSCMVMLKTNMLGTSHFLQVIGAHIVAIGRTQELALEKEKKEALSAAELSAAVQEKEKVIIELSSFLKRKETELIEERRLQLSSAEQKKTVKSENDQLVARLKELETDVYEAFAQGFDRVVSQVKVFFPEADVMKLDATKVVVNNELVNNDAMVEKRERELKYQ
ncbi:uncharacterized protein LOC110271725 isoform X2 [Arachis ipaensis]|uniref:uncharacterized protein LOC110271725 isoform X2 n=1 Tax=Arachis ipaensis TaxID=130454 RepID=UPI000A2B0A40|nr:uncharacterized protein LOC110271725 isoform X2 [Arachis ipaensis]